MPETTTVPQVTVLNPSTKKRRRPALACEQCRKRKVRCDRLSPCTTCVKSQNPECSYPASHQSSRRGSLGGPLSAQVSTGTASSASPVNSGGGDVQFSSAATSFPTPVSRNTPLGAPFFLEGSTVDGHNPSAGQTQVQASAQGQGVGQSKDQYVSSSCPAGSQCPRGNRGSGEDGTSGILLGFEYDNLGSASVNALMERIKDLEKQLEEAKEEKGKPPINIDETAMKEVTGLRGIVDKTRLFGRSHWMNGWMLVSLGLLFLPFLHFFGRPLAGLYKPRAG